MRRLIALALLLSASSFPLHAGAIRGIDRSARADRLLEARFKLFELQWRNSYGERGLLERAPRELAGPAVDTLSGEVVASTRDGRVRLLTASGREIWQVMLPAAATHTPLLTPDGVFVGAADGKLHALDRFDGETVWSAQLGGEVIATPAIDGDTIFVATNQDAVHAFDVFSGEVRWVYRRDTRETLTIRGGTGCSVGDGRVYAGFSDGALVALGPEEGRVIWQTQLAPRDLRKFPDSDATPVYRDGTVWATVFNTGTYALDAATGRVRWTADTRGATSLTLDGDLLLVGGTGLWALQPATGALRWRVETRQSWVTQPQVTAGKLVVASGPKGLLFVERETGRPLRVFDPGSEFASPPAVNGRQLYALSNLGYLYSLRMVVE